MSTVIASLPAEHQGVIVEVLRANSPELLTALLSHDVPTRDEREDVEDILSTEFTRHLKPDYEPTERGVAVDNALGAFLLRWPIEHE